MTITLPPRPTQKPAEGGGTSTTRAPQGPAPAFIPSHLTRPTDILPHAYVVHHHTQRCTNCSTSHSWSALYALNSIRSRSGSGRPVDNLVAVDALLYKIPISVVHTSPKSIPTCFECAPDGVDLSHLPAIQDTEAWRSTAVRRELEAIAARLSKNLPPPEPTPPSPPKAGAPRPLTTQQALDLI